MGAFPSVHPSGIETGLHPFCSLRAPHSGVCGCVAPGCGNRWRRLSRSPAGRGSDGIAIEKVRQAAISAGTIPKACSPGQHSAAERAEKKPYLSEYQYREKIKKSFGHFAVPFDTLVNFCLPPLVNRITGRCLAYHLLTFHRPLAIIPASRVQVIVSAFPWQEGRSLIYRNMVEK